MATIASNHVEIVYADAAGNRHQRPLHEGIGQSLIIDPATGEYMFPVEAVDNSTSTPRHLSAQWVELVYRTGGNVKHGQWLYNLPKEGQRKDPVTGANMEVSEVIFYGHTEMRAK